MDRDEAIRTGIEAGLQDALDWRSEIREADDEVVSIIARAVSAALAAVEAGPVHECEWEWSRYCGAKVCDECGAHHGLERCYCGWSRTSAGNGRRELIEMGETIEDEG